MKGKKTGGRQKGSLNQKTKQWMALGESIVSKHAERLNDILDNCDDEMFLKHYTQILEYFEPKLARTEIRADLDIQTVQPLIIQPIKVKDASS